jgi:hypothetical protein
MKRQRLADVQSTMNCVLLKSFETRGILELVYSFLMNPCDFDDSTDEQFLEFRTICKGTKVWSPRLFAYVKPRDILTKTMSKYGKQCFLV